MAHGGALLTVREEVMQANQQANQQANAPRTFEKTSADAKRERQRAGYEREVSEVIKAAMKANQGYLDVIQSHNNRPNIGQSQ